MKTQYLKKLDKALLILKTEERAKYLEEFAGSIADRIENGMAEEQAVLECGDSSVVAKAILDSYGELEGKNRQMISRYISGMYILGDLISMLISYIVAAILWFLLYRVGDNGIFLNLGMSIPVILIYLASCFIFRIYTISHAKQRMEQVVRIIVANLFGFTVINLILYFTNIFFFARIILYVFTGLNMLFMVVRYLWGSRKFMV